MEANLAGGNRAFYDQSSQPRTPRKTRHVRLPVWVGGALTGARLTILADDGGVGRRDWWDETRHTA